VSELEAAPPTTFTEWAEPLLWIDGSPLVIEPYRLALFARFFDERDSEGRPLYNLGLWGRAKKNWKTSDLMLAALFALVGNDEPGGNQVYVLANDEGQAADDLDLAKKLVGANPPLKAALAVRQRELVRADGGGALTILPAGDVRGAHGKTFRLVCFDEIHGYRDWGILEAMQLDPHRPEAQMLITSYASLHHRPGVPLFDMMQKGWAGSDPRMLFSWYGADRSTDADYAEAAPEARANPSMGTWADQGYLAQQAARLPSHQFRRLHLNLPGLPEGAAFSAEGVMAAVLRGVKWEPRQAGRVYLAFVDMSGGSNDYATLAIGYAEGNSYRIIRVVDQGQPPPFDPAKCPARWRPMLAEYGLSKVWGDSYAGQTFREAFLAQGILYNVCPLSASDLYEHFEPLLNAGRVAWVEEPKVEQEALGLLWRGSKITTPGNEHDDFINSVAGCVYALDRQFSARQELTAEQEEERRPTGSYERPVIEAGGNFETLILARYPADGAARIAYAKSMSLDRHGDLDPTVYGEYLLENLPDVQRQERGRRSAGL